MHRQKEEEKCIKFDWFTPNAPKGNKLMMSLHLRGLLQVNCFGQLLAEIGGNLGEVRDGTFLDEALCIDQMTGDVGHESLTGSFVQN